MSLHSIRAGFRASLGRRQPTPHSANDSPPQRQHMRFARPALGAVTIFGLSWLSTAYRNSSGADLLQSSLAFEDDRSPGCPPCFNCNLDDFQCAQFSPCSKSNGKCKCRPGFGWEDCSQPFCGSLAQGKEREPRINNECECDEGWGGINCNMCKADQACNAMMPDNTGGVCYTGGVVVKENYQMCDVTNRKILDLLKERKPQITFSCNGEDKTCNFQCMATLGEIWPLADWS